jgi:hypothetical protein
VTGQIAALGINHPVRALTSGDIFLF